MEDNDRRPQFRQVGRWLALVVSVALALWGTIPLGALSPFVAVCSALAVKAAGFLTLLGLPVLVLVILSRRWFCRYACPVGLLHEVLGTLRPAAGLPLRFPFVGKWAALLTVGGALLGYPILLWMDPLAIFNGFVAAWRQPLTFAVVCAGLALPVVLLLDLIVPKIWCTRLCPLGGTQDLLYMRKPEGRGPKAEGNPISEIRTGRSVFGTRPSAFLRGFGPRPSDFSSSRRGFLAACIGVASAPLIKATRGQTPPLRPPGALDEARFTGVCIRCGNCTSVCPTKILHPDLGEHGLAGLLAPVMRFENGYCKENCHRCNEVCPSGAIARLSLAEKRQCVIGPAEVDLDTCLLANGQDCTACIRACPYEALAVTSTDGGFTSRPGLDLKKCVGCGACEVACPVGPRRAIRVVPKPGLLAA